MSLKQKTISNIKWSFIESMSMKAITFLLGIILARLFSPEDFGLLAVVNVFYLLVTLFIDGGLKEALIQKKEATDSDYSTVFWLNLLVSIIIYGVLYIAAPYIQEYFGYENLAFLVRLQLVVLFIEAVGIVQIIRATKELQLKKITKARIPAALISFFVGIILAYFDYGILSLIIQQIVNSLIYNALLVFNIRYKPVFIFDWVSARSLWKYGYKVILISLLSRFYAQGVSLIFAKNYPIDNLGLYTKARSFQNTPIEIITTTYNKGLYPTMVRMQNNNRGMKAILLGNIHRLSYLMVLINVIIFYNAYEIIDILFGEKWLSMTIFLQISALGTLFQPISNQTVSVFKARGKPKAVLNIELLSKAISLALIFLLIAKYELYVVFAGLTVILSMIALLYFYLCSIELKFNVFIELKKMFIMGAIHFSIGYLAQYIAMYFFDYSLLRISLFLILFFGGVLVVSNYSSVYKLSKIFK